MRILLRKARGDLRRGAAQLGTLALVVALGGGSLMGAFGAHAILEQSIDESYAAARVPDLVLRVEDADAAFVEALAARDDVEALHARRIAYTRIEVAHERFLPLRLTIADDIMTAGVGTVHRHDRAGGLRDGSVFIEQSGAALLDPARASVARIMAPNGSTVALTVAGFVHDTAVAPSTQERIVYAYANRSTAALLGLPRALDEVWIRARDPASAPDLAERLTAWSRARGHPILRADVVDRVHPHASLMRALLRVLALAGCAGLLAATTLAGALVGAWMRRETRTLGVMKAIGAGAFQVGTSCLGVLLPIVLAGAALGVPVAAGVTWLLVRACAALLNVDVVDTTTLTHSIEGRWLGLTLLLPLLAAAPAVARVLRSPAHLSIADPGIDVSAGFSARHRLGWLRFAQHATWTLALRSTLRRPWRSGLIVLALASGTALFVTTRSNEASMLRVIDRALAHQAHDVEIVLQHNQPIERIEAVALGVPGVLRAEAWPRASVSRDASSPAAGASSTRRFALVGLPARSGLFALPVTHGRLPLSAASDEALATRALADQDPDVRVGSTIGIDFQGQPHRLRVVGVVDEIGTPTLYASTTAFASVTSLGRVANAVRLKTRPGEIESTAAAVEHALFDAGLQPAQRLTRTMLRDALEEHFQVVGFVLQAAAAAAGVLGTLFLAAAAAAATHERTREIGILRALGATRRHIVALLLAEALTILLAGAAVGTMAALGLTAIMNEAAAQTLLHVSVPFVLSLEAVVLLLGAMLATLAVVALSVGRIVARPARGALCYE